ncbi:MAG: sugar phosphate nucleotidyltransferase [Myxococcota bacterium]
MSASAFILGAGFGTRLRPLTLTHPKPLMPILGRPLIDYALASLKQANIEHIMVNAHYLWEQVARWAEHNTVELQLELPDILGTGGGLKAALPRLNDKVIIWNGDILCDVSASKLLDACPENGAVMALRHSQNLGKTTPLLHDNGLVTRIGDICSVPNAPEAIRGGEGHHFTGIHAMARQTLHQIPNGEQCVVRTAYRTLVPDKKVNAHLHDGYWLDIGNPSEYWQTLMAILRREVELPIDPWTEHSDTSSWVSPRAQVDGQLTQSVIEAGATVPKGVELNQCVVWENVTVPKGKYRGCIFTGTHVINADPSQQRE